MKPLAILTDESMTAHDPGPSHPERPGRLAAILEALQRTPIALAEVIAPHAADREQLEQVHAAAYVANVLALAGRHASLDADTVLSPHSVPAALTAAGAAVQAVECVLSGEFRRGFGLVRPPGHHAEADRAMGFCLFNNVAVAAATALQQHALQRVLVVDWDVHHGNGTQHLFEDDEQVLVFNLHQSPLYPGTGAVEEVGRGRGRGFTVNVPLPAGCGDAEYEAAFEQLLEPIAAEFQPELMLLSAGFDAHRDDPLGSMRITTPGFSRLCARVCALADEHAAGRLVAMLEGGYHLQALARSVQACAAVMAGASPLAPTDPQANPAAAGLAALERAIDRQREFWRL